MPVRLTFIVRAIDGGNGGTSNPLARSLIGNGESPSANPFGAPRLIAPIREGAGTGVYDDAWAAAEGRLHCDFHIADHVYWTRNNFREQTPDDFGNLRTGCAGEADAGSVHLRRCDACRFASVTNGLVQRFPRALFSDPHHIAGPRSRGHEQRTVITNHASRFRPAAVDAQKDAHG